MEFMAQLEMVNAGTWQRARMQATRPHVQGAGRAALEVWVPHPTQVWCRWEVSQLWSELFRLASDYVTRRDPQSRAN